VELDMIDEKFHLQWSWLKW